MAVGSKLLPSSYPTIQHLPGSKMREVTDKSIGQQEADWLTVETRLPTDIVTITEKVDGCNVGVLRKNNTLYPIIRKGYDVRTSPYVWIRDFSVFVDDHRQRLLHLLSEGERVCGDWMIKTHTVQYDMPHEPLICFDIIKGNERDLYSATQKRLAEVGLISAGVVHTGTSLPTSEAIKLLGDGFHGAIGAPEGVVYRYESVEHGWLFSAKYVSNPLVGDQDLLQRNIENNLMNHWRGGIYH